jgi:hypothetical protein
MIFVGTTVNHKMAKKKKQTGKATQKRVSSKSKSKSKSGAKKSKYKKKRGRKPSVPNRYNAIRTAITQFYLTAVGRRIRRYELKVIYDWIKANYANQSVRYIVMNIDVILDSFWTEYCNLFPVNINDHARFFDWFLFKNILIDEAEFHFPNDIIEVDFTEVGYGILEFLAEDYPSKIEDYYDICKQSGVKQSSPPPALFLESAYCDVSRRGNIFKYKLLVDGQVPSDIPSPTPIPPSPSIPPVQPVTAPTTPVQPSAPSEPLPPEQVQLEVEKERLRKEFELKNRKLDELSELLRQKVITFEEYLRAVKEL